MTNEEASDFSDAFQFRSQFAGFEEISDGQGSSGIVSNIEGQRRSDFDIGKSLFSDFIPSVAVYNIRGAAGATPGVVFQTNRVIFSNIRESSSEASQVLKTFSPGVTGDDLHVSFYGEMPRVYSFSGTLFHLRSKNDTRSSENKNTPDGITDANWFDSFKYAYENLLKGSKCAELGLQVRVSYDWRWSQGYLLNFGSNFSVGQPGEVPFEFSMLVVKSGTYHRADEITARSFVDRAVQPVDQEAANEGVFKMTPGGTVQFHYDG